MKDKALLILDALVAAHDSVPERTNMDLGVALLMFFDRLHKRDPRFMPLVIGTWREEHQTALHDVAAERFRQIHAEGWTPEHDDTHSRGQMGAAAACYLIHASHLGSELPLIWPWSMDWWKPTTRRRDLVKAGALILAEIDRLDRAAEKAVEP